MVQTVLKGFLNNFSGNCEKPKFGMKNTADSCTTNRKLKKCTNALFLCFQTFASEKKNNTTNGFCKEEDKEEEY